MLFDGERWKSLLAFAANPSACWALSPPVLRTGLEARRRRAGEAQGRQAVHSRALRLRVRRRQGRRVAHVGQHVAYLPRLCADGCVGWGGAWLQHAQGHMWQLPPAARPCAVRGSALGVTARPRLPLAWLLRRRAPYHSLRRGLHTRERRQLNLEIQQARVSGGADNAPEQQLALAWTDALVVQPPGRSGRRGPAARKAGFTHPRAPFKHPAPLPPPAMLTSTGPAATIGTCRHPTRTPACSRRRPSPRSSRNT